MSALLTSIQPRAATCGPGQSDPCEAGTKPLWGSPAGQVGDRPKREEEPVVYVPLGVRTEYGFLDGMCRVEALIERARDLRMPAVGITDLDSTYGFVPFFVAARAAGVRPLLGITIRVEADTPAQAAWEGSTATLQLLARDAQGLGNILRLTSRAHLEILPGAQGNAEPSVGFQDLEEFAAGIVALDGGVQGPVTRALRSRGEAAANSVARRLREIFGAQSYFIRIERDGLHDDSETESALVRLAYTLNVPLVAVTDTRYLETGDAEAFAVLQHIGGHSSTGHGATWLRSDLEMRNLFRDLPDALANTNLVAAACAVDLDLGRPLPFAGASASGRAAGEELRVLCERGLARRSGSHPENLPAAVRDRLRHELTTLEETELASCFLVVQDVVRRARAAGIPVGPGRGAAAGSLVAYATGITDVDPLPHGLAFERFVSRTRRGVPAFDFEVGHRHRDVLLRDVLRHFGPERAVRSAVRTPFSARTVVRAVGESLRLDAEVLDAVLADLRTESSGNLWQALDHSPRLRRAYQDDLHLRGVLEVARRLEGIPRNPTLQAGGLWIAPHRLTDVVALQRTRFGDVVAQGSEEGLQALGLLRIEFGASRAVTVVGDSVRLVARSTAPDTAALELDRIPLTDAATYEALASGDHLGVPQVEGAVTQSALRAMQPVCFDDLVAALCLARAGVHEGGRLDRVWTLPDHASSGLRDRVVPVLAESRGLLLYPEQVLRLAADVAGYSADEAVVLLDALQKRRIGDLARHRARFLRGALENGMSLEDGECVFDAALRFGSFDLDKAQAVTAALLAYQAAYLRTHHRAEFLAALLNARGDRLEAVREIVADARSRGLELRPVDVQCSTWDHTVEGNAVRIGLQLVRGLTAPVAERLERERAQRPFASMDDVRRRVPGLSGLALESLAKAGGFAGLGLGIEAALDEIAASLAPHGDGAQLELGLLPDRTPSPGEISVLRRIELETEALGVALHSDPLLQRASSWGRLDLLRSTQLAELSPGGAVRVGGRVRRVNETRTRRGERMAFLELEDPWGTLEIVVFPGAFSRTPREALHAGSQEYIVAVAGKLEQEGTTLRVIAESVEIVRTEDVARIVSLADHVAGAGAIAAGPRSAGMGRGEPAQISPKPAPLPRGTPGERRVS